MSRIHSDPGQAKLIKAGSDLVFQMHYTANGKTAQRTRPSVGIDLRERAARRARADHRARNDKFVIPPGDGNYRVPAGVDTTERGTLLSFFPHMHVRGKAFEYKLTQPGGEQRRCCSVPNYNFNWQLTYRLEQPIALQARSARWRWRAGSTTRPTTVPTRTPRREVRWGEQSWEEMMIGFFDVAVPSDMDRRKFFQKEPVKSDD